MEKEFADYIIKNDAKIEELQKTILELQSIVQDMNETYCRHCEIMFPCTTSNKASN